MYPFKIAASCLSTKLLFWIEIKMLEAVHLKRHKKGTVIASPHNSLYVNKNKYLKQL